jgi:hypothetical protein
LISIGRLTPVITSTFPGDRQLIARFEAVPPNMSVRISTPAPSSTRPMACAISACASSVSSCQPIETAANRGRSPTIVSAAFNSSVASCP